MEDNFMSAKKPKPDMGDELMDDMAAPPKRAPPKLGQRKPPAKKAAAADDGDDDGKSAAAPAKKGPGGPPARLAGASGAAKPSTGTAKIITIKDIKEEEIGAGIGKEDALAKVAEFYDATHVGKFEEAKWQQKVEGFNGLKEQIESLKPNERMVEATCKFIKTKMKDWKESNINLMKESIFTF